MNKNDAKIDRYIQNYENQSKKFWKDYINYCSKNPYTICECKDFKCGRLEPNEENQLLHIENQRLIEIEKSHKKLNGELRMEFLEEIEKVKKEADRLMMKKITKYEKKIRELKQYAEDMYNYP